ncbi:MAG: YIP1 family protein [Planctomycetota bacterium]|nr:YIP1 family protein [Planctomycetota bacterium]
MEHGSAIRFPCSGCRQQLAVDADAGGRRIKCPTCGLIQDAPLRSPEPVFVPAEVTGQAGPAPETVAGIPWERRHELGLLNALWQNVGELLRTPADFFGRMHPFDDFAGAVFFAAILLFVGAFAGFLNEMLWDAVTGDYWVRLLDSLKEESVLLSQLEIQRPRWLDLWVLPVVVAFSFLIMCVIAVVQHAAVAALGGGRFVTTFKVVAYAQAADLLIFIPFIGGLCALVAKIALCYTGFKICHRLSWDRALFAAVLPVLLVCMLLAMLLVGSVLLVILALR